jgi:hypothetical protein
LRITVDCKRDPDGRLEGTVRPANRADLDPLEFSGIVELIERIEAIEETLADSDGRHPSAAG